MRLVSALSVVLVACLLGCTQRHTIIYGAGAPTRGAPTARIRQSHFINGLVGVAAIDVDRICDSPDATVKQGVSVGAAILGSLTLGIYTPTVARIWCATARASRVAPPPPR
jgi:hypothetical protein